MFSASVMGVGSDLRKQLATENRPLHSLTILVDCSCPLAGSGQRRRGTVCANWNNLLSIPLRGRRPRTPYLPI
jgi:hypothetical protein